MMYYQSPFMVQATRFRTAARWLFVAATVIFLVGAVAVGVSGVQRNNQRESSRAKLFHIGSALGFYESIYGRFPPQISSDSSGKHLQSWRGILVPFMEARMSSDVFYDPNLPWNSPENLPFAETGLSYYCPNGSTDRQTITVAVSGDGFLFNGSAPPRNKHITRERANIIAVIEVQNSGIGWAEPRDWSEAEFIRRFEQCAVGPYPDGFRAVMADGSIQVIKYDRGLDQVLKMFRIADGK